MQVESAKPSSKILKATVASVLLIAFVRPAEAQRDAVLDQALTSLYGTISTKAVKLTSEGTLQGCSVNFQLIFRDWTYSHGRPFLASGSFLYHTNKAMGMVFGLKVVLAEIDRKAIFSQPVFAPTHFAYLEAKKANNAKAHTETAPSDTANEGRLYVFNAYLPESLEKMQAIMDGGPVTLVFNREKGGSDIRVPIDLTVLDTNDRGERRTGFETVTEFSSCLGEFFALVEKRLENK